MEIAKSELLDRISILTHKTQKIGPEIYPEYVKLTNELLFNFPLENIEEAIKGIRKLYELNGEIWKLEFDIRRGKEKQLGLTEVGRRAIAIRGWNGKRISEKNRLNKVFGEDEFMDIKKDHASA